MSNQLQILQANVNKSSNVSQSLFNDPQLSMYSFIALTEPWSRLSGDIPYLSPMFHTYWTPFYPTKVNHLSSNNTVCFRSMIWVNMAQKSRQVPIDHPDLTAVISQVQERMLLLVSVYIPCSSGNRDMDQERLNIIRSIRYSDLEIILTADFNRWDTLWGGNRVACHPRQGEGELLIDLLAELNRQLLLPPGTVTYQGRGRSTPNCSAIDLIFTTAQLARELLICQPHETQHGSDHGAIQTTFSLCLSAPLENTRLLFKNAPWTKITQQVQDDLAQNTITAPRNNVNEFASQ